MKPKISIKRAKELSVYKWQKIVDNGGSSWRANTHHDPKLLGVFNTCGFCHRWRNNTAKNSNAFNSECQCNECEFAKAMGTYCTDESSKNQRKNLYMKWVYVSPIHDAAKATRLAKRILKLIQSIPEIEPK